MGYHPRIETAEMGSFQTTRSRNSELWFVNNPELENAILGYCAKCQKRYSSILYAFAIEGNHNQFPAKFPDLNRSSFMRDLNSSTARAVQRLCPDYPGGRFWGRRYSNEFLPRNEDIEKQFFYTVLQPVQDGLVDTISKYPGYNCFHDAVNGIKRKYKVVNWAKYNATRRYNPDVRIKDFTELVELEYARLPGYEHLSQREYSRLMNKKLEEHRSKLVEARYAEGKGFAGREALLRTRPGAKPKNTKTSTQEDHRPRILTDCPKTREDKMAWYFEIYFNYKSASKRYRAGELDVEFPPGTYRPYLPLLPPDKP